MSDDKPKKLVDPRGPGTGWLKIGGDHFRPGRPSNEFRQALRDIVDQDEAREKVREILNNPGHPQYASLWKAVTAQAYGNPVQQIEVNSDSLPVLKVERE